MKFWHRFATYFLALVSLTALAVPLLLPPKNKEALAPPAKIAETAKEPPPKSEAKEPEEPQVVETGLRQAPLKVRGIYLTSWSASTGKMGDYLAFLKKHNLNCLVIDLKDDLGQVSYPTNSKLGLSIGAGTRRISNLREILTELKKEGIYTIARIVAFKDPLLAQKRGDLAFKTLDGHVWRDRRGHSWVNPYNREVWDYLLALGEEALALGFSEVQYDYVRFPSDGNLKNLSYPKGKAESEQIGAFLSFVTARLHQNPRAIVSADTFGLAGTALDDLGIGQKIEALDGTCDYLSPMVYPSHYAKGSYGLGNPNAHPYETVKRSLQDHQERVSQSRLRPWLQAFTLGAPPYGGGELAAQIRALRELGIEEFLLWNPSSRYGAVAGGLGG